MTSVVVQSAEKFYRCNRKAFLLVLPHVEFFFIMTGNTSRNNRFLSRLNVR